jgi:hypothetical protein
LLNLKLKIQMKITFLSGALLFLGSSFSSFAASENEGVVVYEAMHSHCDSTAPHAKGCACAVRIQLGNDGDDNVLSPEARKPFHGGERNGRSTVFVAATALVLASRALKSR